MPSLMIDPEQVGLALTELLHNAVAASPTESIHVRAAINQDLRGLVIKVSDNGVGMDARTVSRAADPFFSAKPAGRGIGMGLTRAQLWAAAHKGTLDLKSSPGRGS